MYHMQDRKITKKQWPYTLKDGPKRAQRATITGFQGPRYLSSARVGLRLGACGVGGDRLGVEINH